MLFILLLLCVLFWIGFKITGVILGAIFWLTVELPVSLLLWSLGLVCCCTILLIPLGLKFFAWGAHVMVPGI